MFRPGMANRDLKEVHGVRTLLEPKCDVGNLTGVCSVTGVTLSDTVQADIGHGYCRTGRRA